MPATEGGVGGTGPRRGCRGCRRRSRSLLTITLLGDDDAILDGSGVVSARAVSPPTRVVWSTDGHGQDLLHLGVSRPPGAGGPPVTPVAGAGQQVVVLRPIQDADAAGPGWMELAAVAPDSGEPIWAQQLDAGLLATSDLVATDDGDVRWQRELAVCGRPSTTGAAVLVPTTTGVTCLDLVDGAVRWTSRMRRPSCWTPVSVGGTVTIAGDTSTVTGLDAITGAHRWTTELDRAVCATDDRR